MPSPTKFRALVPAAACALLAACAGPKPAAYTGLNSTSYLKPSTQGDSDKVPYRYSTQVKWSDYSKVIIDPVMIYHGSDNQLGKLPGQDRTSLANYMQTQFSDTLGKRFTLTTTPGPGTLRIQLTLTGAAPSTPFISTFAHLDIGGNIYNAVQAARGGDGLATGWVMYSVEIYDSTTNQLLEAYEAKEYPNAFNPAATFGSLTAAKSGIDKGANMLLADMN